MSLQVWLQSPDVSRCLLAACARALSFLVASCSMFGIVGKVRIDPALSSESHLLRRIGCEERDDVRSRGTVASRLSPSDDARWRCCVWSRTSSCWQPTEVSSTAANSKQPQHSHDHTVAEPASSNSRSDERARLMNSDGFEGGSQMERALTSPRPCSSRAVCRCRSLHRAIQGG